VTIRILNQLLPLQLPPCRNEDESNTQLPKLTLPPPDAKEAIQDPPIPGKTQKMSLSEVQNIEKEMPIERSREISRKVFLEMTRNTKGIEKFLNTFKQKELLDLCMQLCALDPGLLHALKKDENGDMGEDQHIGLRKILIYGLNPKLSTAEDLEKAFGKHGKVSEAVVIRDPKTELSKGYGFVTMSSVAETGAALENAPRMLNGWPTRCTLATTRRK